MDDATCRGQLLVSHWTGSLHCPNPCKSDDVGRAADACPGMRNEGHTYDFISTHVLSISKQLNCVVLNHHDQLFLKNSIPLKNSKLWFCFDDAV
jgi:hypothetical protein